MPSLVIPLDPVSNLGRPMVPHHAALLLAALVEWAHALPLDKHKLNSMLNQQASSSQTQSAPRTHTQDGTEPARPTHRSCTVRSSARAWCVGRRARHPPTCLPTVVPLAAPRLDRPAAFTHGPSHLRVNQVTRGDSSECRAGKLSVACHRVRLRCRLQPCGKRRCLGLQMALLSKWSYLRRALWCGLALHLQPHLALRDGLQMPIGACRSTLRLLFLCEELAAAHHLARAAGEG